jgi:hypothetical protein
MGKIEIYKFGGLYKTYTEYLFSVEWKEKRDLYLESVSKCEICGIDKKHNIVELRCLNWVRAYYKGTLNRIKCKPGIPCKHRLVKWIITVGKPLIVHHKNYFTVGNESRSDLQAVCFDCHAKVHNKEK